MKTFYFKNGLILALMLGSFCACSLKEDTLPFVNQETYYKNEAQCKTVVNSCYIELHSIYSSDLSLITETTTDVLYNTNTTVDAHLEVTPSKPQYGATVWKRGYRGVELCNDAIACISATPHVNDSIKNVLTAECRVLRAMYYYILTNNFDGVPYYTCQMNSYKVQDSVRFLGRTPADTIRRRLYNDLKENALPYFTEANGLKVKSTNAPGRRSGYAHALMLMAKFAMWYEDWDAALEPLQALEDLYGRYTPENPEAFEADYPLDNVKWSYKGKDKNEVIFEIQHEYDITGIKKYGNLAKIMMPNRGTDATTGKFLWDGVDFGDKYGTTLPGANVTRVNPMFASYRPYGNPDKDGTGVTSTSVNCMFGLSNLPLAVDLENKSGRDQAWGVKLDLNKVYDKRALLNFAIGNLENGKLFNFLNKEGYFSIGEKFWCPNILSNYDSNNYKIFRYADALLMMAECWYHKGDEQRARDYIDIVRGRAGLPRMEMLAGQDLMNEIVVERAKELFGEFHRKWDLVRWGIWYDRTKTYNAYNKLKEHMRPCHEYYPIPDSQCALSGYALDNPTYKSDGLN
jgi:hypothetical protein